MNRDDYNILYCLMKDLHNELNDLNEQLQYNRRCAKEADIYVRSFINGETEDFKFFSPRNAETVHKEEIEKIYSEKAEYEKRCTELEEKINILIKRIDSIKDILEHEKNNLTVLNIQEEDRQRIARDLHDTSLQNLAYLIHKIELSSLYIDKDAVQAKLELSSVNKCLRETIEQIRNVIFNLRPMTFDDLGFKAALERLLDNINENQKYKVIQNIEDVSCENNLVLVSVYRIIQENLNNIVKHAECRTINFSCKYINGVCIIDIKDDGNGFDRKKIDNDNKHFGLSIMKERVELLNGKVQIDSKLGEGTEIHIEIPLEIYNV